MSDKPFTVKDVGRRAVRLTRQWVPNNCTNGITEYLYSNDYRMPEAEGIIEEVSQDGTLVKFRDIYWWWPWTWGEWRPAAAIRLIAEMPAYATDTDQRIAYYPPRRNP